MGGLCGKAPNVPLTPLLVSPLHRDGTARRRAANRPGMALEQARRRKEATYPELVGDDGRARLVVLAAETGGRWFNETAHFLRGLAKGKAETAPHAEPCPVSVVEKVELHLGVQCSKGLRSVPLGVRTHGREWTSLLSKR